MKFIASHADTKHFRRMVAEMKSDMGLLPRIHRRLALARRLAAGLAHRIAPARTNKAA